MAEDFGIDLGDFESALLTISVSNATSGTTIARDIVNGPAPSIQEFLERGLVLELPKGSCAQGHRLLMEIEVLKPASKQMTFSTTAKVDEVTPVSGSANRVAVTLVQFDEDGWSKLRGLFASRQQEIEDFFKAAKGF